MFKDKDVLTGLADKDVALLMLLGCGSILTRTQGLIGEYIIYGQLPNHKNVRIVKLRSDVDIEEVNDSVGSIQNLPAEVGENFLKLHFNLVLTDHTVLDVIRTNQTIEVVIGHTLLDQMYMIGLYPSPITGTFKSI